MSAFRNHRWLPWLLAGGLILSLAVVGIFSMRAVRLLPHLRGNETIRPWMTLPYIAHANHVPAAGLYQALGLPYQAHDLRPLSHIARLQGAPVQTIITRLESALPSLRQEAGTPAPRAAPTGAPGPSGQGAP